MSGRAPGPGGRGGARGRVVRDGVDGGKGEADLGRRPTVKR